MPKLPDLPCAVCGRLMTRNPQTLALGLATCRPCRAASRRTAPKLPCIVDGCTARQYSKAMCTKHYQQVRSRGAINPPRVNGPQHHAWQHDAITYRTMHTRLTNHRGKASDHRCADCSQRADDWSYDGTDPRAQHDRHGYFTAPEPDED